MKNVYVKGYDGQDDNLLEKYNTIWDEVGQILKKNSITNLPTIKNF